MTGLHFYIDVDDVLAETTRALSRMARDHFGKTVRFEEMRVFDLSVSLGLDAAEFPAFMAAAHERDFLLGLAAIPGAADTLAAWRDAGAEISVVTGRPPECRATTLDWLEDQGIAFDRLEFIDKYARYGDSGAATPETLRDRGYHAVVEDSDAMALDLARHSDARVFLYDRPWNQDSAAEAHGARRVRDWGEIQELIQELIETGR